MLVRFNKRGDGVSIAIDVAAVPRVGEYVSIEGPSTVIAGDVHEVAHVIESVPSSSGHEGWRTEIRVIVR